MASPIDPVRQRELTALFHRWRDHADDDALGELFTELQELMVVWARRVVGNDADAEDATTQAFLKIIERPWLFDPDRGPFLTWVYLLVTSQAMDIRRRLGRRARLAAPPGGGEAAAPGTGPGAEAEQADTAAAVQQALGRLAEKHSELAAVLTLRFLEGLTLDETAARLGSSITTVHRREKQALEELRLALGGTHGPAF